MERVIWAKHEEPPPGANYGRHRPETAAYACEECGSLWDDAARNAAVSEADRRAQAGDKRVGWVAERPFRGIAGFHISGFLSPWRTFERMVIEYLDFKDDEFALQVWTNSVLACLTKASARALTGAG